MQTTVYPRKQDPAEIAAEMGGKPSKQAITIWGAKKDRDGKTWRDLRREYRDSLFQDISPQSIAAKILNRIKILLDDDANLKNEKTADALVKYQVSLAKLTDPRYQVPTMFYFLKEMISFLRKNYPELVNKKFLLAVQDFKNHLRESMNHD
jgi:hypothetical protein